MWQGTVYASFSTHLDDNNILPVPKHVGGALSRPRASTVAAPTTATHLLCLSYFCLSTSADDGRYQRGKRCGCKLSDIPKIRTKPTKHEAVTLMYTNIRMVFACLKAVFYIIPYGIFVGSLLDLEVLRALTD